MHCHHCVGSVREALSQISGIDVLEVDIGSARVTSSGGEDEAVAAALDQEGYSLVDISDAKR